MKHYEIFTGRVGQIRDLTELQNGNCVVSFSVAETPRIKKADGSWADGVTIWTDVSVFGDEARNFVRSAKPGTFVTVTGTRNAREYTPKDSTEKRVVQQVVAEQLSIAITKFNFIESVGNVNYAKDGRGGGTQAPQQNYNQAAPQQNQAPQQNYNQADPDPFKIDADPFASTSGNENPFGSDDDPFKLG